MDAPKTQRLTIRFTDEDLQWLDQQAADEGVEPAQLVRMIIHRLRNDRPPLVGQMLGRAEYNDPKFYQPVRRPVASHLPPLPVGGEDYDSGEHVAPEVASDILESRLAEAELAPAQETNGHAAISLHRVPREKYNPGRQ